MKREDRFIGNGNVWIANSQHRGWQVTCAGCGVTKLISSHRHGMLPNEVVLKKFLQAGWSIGVKPGEDLCISCSHPRKPQSNGHAETPPQVAFRPTEAPARPRLPPFNNATEYFDQLRRLVGDTRIATRAKTHKTALHYIDELALRLDPSVTDALVAMIRPPAPSAPPTPSPPVDDTEYNSWLAELGGQPS